MLQEIYRFPQTSQGKVMRTQAPHINQSLPPVCLDVLPLLNLSVTGRVSPSLFDVNLGAPDAWCTLATRSLISWCTCCVCVRLIGYRVYIVECVRQVDTHTHTKYKHTAKHLCGCGAAYFSFHARRGSRFVELTHGLWGGGRWCGCCMCVCVCRYAFPVHTIHHHSNACDRSIARGSPSAADEWQISCETANIYARRTRAPHPSIFVKCVTHTVRMVFMAGKRLRRERVPPSLTQLWFNVYVYIRCQCIYAARTLVFLGISLLSFECSNWKLCAGLVAN